VQRETARVSRIAKTGACVNGKREKAQKLKDVCRKMIRLAEVFAVLGLKSEMDWPKRDELRTPTGWPGLRWLKTPGASTLNVRL
jgi:hypothetical protein